MLRLARKYTCLKSDHDQWPIGSVVTLVDSRRQMNLSPEMTGCLWAVLSWVPCYSGQPTGHCCGQCCVSTCGHSAVTDQWPSTILAVTCTHGTSWLVTFYVKRFWECPPTEGYSGQRCSTRGWCPVWSELVALCLYLLVVIHCVVSTDHHNQMAGEVI